MKESRSCFTCQRHSLNFITATCGHKICFNCVKNNKNSHKCSICIANQPRSRSYLSPSRNVSQQHKEHKQKTTKMKNSQSKTHIQFSPIPSNKTKPLRSNMKSEKQDVQDLLMSSKTTLICKQHQQPLSMYCKSIKELMCSICLCSKTKYHDVMPIKSAEEHLRKQNKIHREESKSILSNVQNAQKIMMKNIQIFKLSYQNSFHNLQSYFQLIKREVQIAESHAKQKLGVFFENKLNECQQILGDLGYLNQILREFKQNNKENSSLNELVYLFTSFKVIKGTIKNLDLDYIPYSKEPQVIDQLKTNIIKDNLKNSVNFNLQLPLKIGQRSKIKSNSRSVSRSKNEEWDELNRGNQSKISKQRSNMIKKHQMSLCSNIHGIQICQQQRNLYKMLLKTKFKL